MPIGADLLDALIDLDRVNVIGALRQRDRHVAPGAGAHDQDVVRGRHVRTARSTPGSSRRRSSTDTAVWCGIPLRRSAVDPARIALGAS